MIISNRDVLVKHTGKLKYSVEVSQMRRKQYNMNIDDWLAVFSNTVVKQVHHNNGCARFTRSLGICTMNLKRFLNMSTKLSYDEAMGISNTNSHSQFTHCLSQKHIKLMPKYLGNVKSGVVQQLDSEVFVYSKEYVSHSSVPVSFAAPKLTIRKVNVNLKAFSISEHSLKVI